MRITYNNGADASIEVFRKLQMRAHDQRPGWRRAARRLREAVDRQFDTEGVYLTGRRWKPLAPPYAARKKAQGFAGGILTRTGRMRRSFRILRITRNRLVFGSTMDRAAWHHSGSGNNPRRPILNARSRRIRRDINSVLTDFLTEGLT